MTRGMIQTVTGEVSPESLGFTHSHEHLIAYATEKLRQKEPDLLLNDPAPVSIDLLEFRQAGGGCVVEMTTRDYGQDAMALKVLSEKTGVKIVAATGFNKAVYCRTFCESASLEELVAQQIADIQEGIDGTGVRAGVVKFATSLNVVQSWEEMAIRAAARTHLATGVPIVTHTEAGTIAHAQLDLLAEEGVTPDRVVICHLDRNADLDLHRCLIRRGAFISYDQVPKPKYATEDKAIRLITALAGEGLDDHVLVGGDFARRSLFRGWGGAPGLAYLAKTFRPRLEQALQVAGLDSRAVLNRIFVENPARAFAFRD